MIREIELNGSKIKYSLQYKKVKNINLRIKSDGSIAVSAHKDVKIETIEGFMFSKKDIILSTLEKCMNKSVNPPKAYFSECEVKKLTLIICERVYPYFKEKGIEYPQIKFKKMVSQWGNCNVKKGILTFNTNLVYAPMDCIEYVVLHEFTHFLQPNHSIHFYNELEKVCPSWKESKKKLKEIIL